MPSSSYKLNRVDLTAQEYADLAQSLKNDTAYFVDGKLKSIGSDTGPGGSGSSAPTPFSTRTLTTADKDATLTVAAAQTATMVTGLGTSFGCAFYNKTNTSVVLTISVPAGVTVNGVTNGTVTRTIPAWGVTAIQATDVADVYVAPGA
jgi:hypothetical protein